MLLKRNQILFCCISFTFCYVIFVQVECPVSYRVPDGSHVCSRCEKIWLLTQTAKCDVYYINM